MRTLTLAILCAALTTWSISATAQHPPTIRRIGFLGAATSSATLTRRLDPFRQGLLELGYIEGKHFILEVRSAEANFSLLPALAAELVRLKVDVIVTAGPQPTHYAKEATSTIPIVMAFDTDPVGNKFVASLARPGGNVTGLSDFAPEISGKGLELLQEIVPRLSRVAILGTSSRPGNARSLKETANAAQTLGVKLQQFDVLTPQDIDTSFRAAANDRVDGAVVMHSAIHSSHQAQLANLAIKTKIPVMYARREYVEAGGLISYGVNFSDLDRRAAYYVDKILKGANPAEVPVEQPTKFELVINLKAAKHIGLTIPPNVLARADRVIK